MTEVLPRTDRTVADGTWNARLPVSIRPRAKDRCDRSPRCIKTFQAASSLRRICRKLLTANDARPADAAPGISTQMNHLQTEAACRARTRRTEPREPVCEWRRRMDCRRFPPRCVRARRLRRGTRAMGCPTMVETRQRCSDPSGGRTAQPEDGDRVRRRFGLRRLDRRVQRQDAGLEGNAVYRVDDLGKAPAAGRLAS